MPEPKQILVKYWGYSSFRPLQEEIIQSLLEGKDTLALLPTGGGKSICFQVPAMCMEGICIVVSPLIALMKDQVSNLNKRGIKAVAVYSGQSTNEMDIAIDNCIYGKTKFLYLSPERLTTDIIRMRLPRMKVSLLAVDEAHCISHWGYDFRPTYLRIAEIRSIIPKTPVLALTATATGEVVTDIMAKLEFKGHNIFRKSFERKNLNYIVIKEEDKLRRLIKICSKVGGTGIIYVRNRKKTKEIAQYLSRNNISADYYHAGLDTQMRDQKQQEWMKGNNKVIVCTNAFGMGIDKPNVRFVVHMDLPDAPEAYFQEAGRAGRDEKQSFVVLLYNDSDIADAGKSLELAYPPLNDIKTAYNCLGNYFQISTGSSLNKGFDFELTDFCSNYNLNHISTFNALKILEKEGYLFLSEAMSEPSKLHILLDKEGLYRFVVANPLYDEFIKVILRSYEGLFDDYVVINESALAKRIGKTPPEVSNTLARLHKMQVVYYQAQNKKPRIIYTQPRAEQRDLTISPENYAERKKFATLRLEAMKNYVLSVNRCRSIILLDYFGEKNTVRCGNCDICRERNKLDLSKIEFDTIVELIKPILRNKRCNIDTVISEIKTDIPEQRILKVIQWLIDNKKIALEPLEGVVSWIERK